MDSQFIASIVILLSFFLPYFGFDLPSEQLTGLVQAFMMLASTAWIAYKRTRLRQAPSGQGDVNMLGMSV